MKKLILILGDIFLLTDPNKREREFSYLSKVFKTQIQDANTIDANSLTVATICKTAEKHVYQHIKNIDNIGKNHSYFFLFIGSNILIFSFLYILFTIYPGATPLTKQILSVIAIITIGILTAYLITFTRRVREKRSVKEADKIAIQLFMGKIQEGIYKKSFQQILDEIDLKTNFTDPIDDLALKVTNIGNKIIKKVDNQTINTEKAISSKQAELTKHLQNIQDSISQSLKQKTKQKVTKTQFKDFFTDSIEEKHIIKFKKKYSNYTGKNMAALIYSLKILCVSKIVYNDKTGRSTTSFVHCLNPDKPKMSGINKFLDPKGVDFLDKRKEEPFIVEYNTLISEVKNTLLPSTNSTEQ